MLRTRCRVILVLVFLAMKGLVAQEISPWDISAGIGGTEIINTGSSVDTFYWGPFVRAGYQVTDPLKARLGLRHTQNKFLYDGLGGIARQSHTGISPGLSWEITDSFNIDAEYSFRIGENSYREHAGVLGTEYTAFSSLRFALDGSYNQQNYVFPDTGTKISQRSIGVTFETVLSPAKRFEIPLLVNYLNSLYNTNKTTYVARTAALGFTYRAEDRFWGFTLSGTIGSDSSNYSILGGELKIRLNPLDHLSVRITGGITRYGYSADQAGKNKKAQGETLSPLGNSDAFNIQSVGMEVSYTF